MVKLISDNWRLFAIGGVVAVIAFCGLIISGYGSAKYEAGKQKCIADQAAAQVTATNNSIRDRERIENETSNLSDSAVDADLIKFGIVRNDQDR